MKSENDEEPKTPLEEILNVVESNNTILSEISEEIKEILHAINKILEELKHSTYWYDAYIDLLKRYHALDERCLKLLKERKGE